VSLKLTADLFQLKAILIPELFLRFAFLWMREILADSGKSSISDLRAFIEHTKESMKIAFFCL
jgi:hypothetical protein